MIYVRFILRMEFLCTDACPSFRQFTLSVMLNLQLLGELPFQIFVYCKSNLSLQTTAVQENKRAGLISAGSAFPAASVPNTLSTAHQQMPPSQKSPSREVTHIHCPPDQGSQQHGSGVVLLMGELKTLWINKPHSNTGLTLAGCFLSVLIRSLII